ncbi:MAG: hypothetical protein JSW56_15760 [Deltaproteobacteria bacterium]|nr:MAG: hypothetical protein JSW56_15760 [Deltaproteobacteria bacterium]
MLDRRDPFRSIDLYLMEHYLVRFDRCSVELKRVEQEKYSMLTVNFCNNRDLAWHQLVKRVWVCF